MYCEHKKKTLQNIIYFKKESMLVKIIKKSTLIKLNFLKYLKIKYLSLSLLMKGNYVFNWLIMLLQR